MILSARLTYMGVEQRITDPWGNLLDTIVVNPGEKSKTTFQFVRSDNNGYSECEHEVVVRCNPNNTYGYLAFYRGGERVFAKRLKRRKLTTQTIRGYKGQEVVEWEFKPLTPPKI